MPFLYSLKWLTWRRPTPVPEDLPAGIERLWVPTPRGQLELLYAPPAAGAAGAGEALPPVFFVHGGMGSAWVWLEWMGLVAATGRACYAVSMRGHGASWQPGYWDMVFCTRMRQLAAQDVAPAVHFAEERAGVGEGGLVLVGHSSGGGVLQWLLGEGILSAQALVLAGSIPGFGSMEIFQYWASKLDPWSSIRQLLHGYHPNSVLSHPELTRRAFFGDAMKPFSDVVMTFQRHLCPYESLRWPIDMMTRFVRFDGVLHRLRGFFGARRDRKQQALLVIVGSQDKLTRPDISLRLADEYRQTAAGMTPDGGIEGDVGVRYEVVEGAGHHLQNDVQLKDGARILCDFMDRLGGAVKA